MNQQHLNFDPPHNGTATSRLAAESVQHDTARMRRQVLDYIRSQGSRGATCDEAEAALGMRHQTASARFKELKDGGLLTKCGRRKTRSGRAAEAWRTNA